MSGSRLSKITISWFSPNFHIFICHEKTIRAMHLIFTADLQLYEGEFLGNPRLCISIRTTGTDINVFRSVWYPVIASMRTHPMLIHEENKITDAGFFGHWFLKTTGSEDFNKVLCTSPIGLKHTWTLQGNSWKLSHFVVDSSVTKA